MKRINVFYLLLASVFLISSCGNEEDNGVWNDRKNEGLKGKVKKVTELNALISDVSRVMEFNPEGFFTYNNDGDFWSMDYQYDSQNRVTEFNGYNENGLIARVKYSYSGTIKEEIFYSAQGEALKMNRYELNGKGMTISAADIRYGVEATKTKYKLNEEGQIIEMETITKDINAYNFTSYGGHHESCYVTKNTYNSKGSLESYVTSECDGTVINSAKYTYKYDSKKNWIEKYNEEGELIRTRTIQYY